MNDSLCDLNLYVRRRIRRLCGVDEKKNWPVCSDEIMMNWSIVQSVCVYTDMAWSFPSWYFPYLLSCMSGIYVTDVNDGCN